MDAADIALDPLVSRPARHVPHRQAHVVRGGEGHLVRHSEEFDHRAGRRIGVRQVGHLARDPRPAAAGEHDHRCRRARSSTAAAISSAWRRVGTARAARRRHLDDLPGADDVAQSGVHRRLPAGGGPAAAHGSLRGAAARKRSIALLAGSRHSRTGPQHRQVSVADVGRPAAARDDRDGHRLRAQAADRRRADDRARRDDPEADPRPDRRSAEEAPDVGAVHHARPGRGGRDRRSRRGDAQRRDPRAGAGQAGVRESAGHLHQGAAQVPARRSTAGLRGCR